MPLIHIQRNWKTVIISAAVTLIAASIIILYQGQINAFFGMSGSANILLVILICVEGSVPFLSVGSKTKTVTGKKGLVESRIIALR